MSDNGAVTWKGPESLRELLVPLELLDPLPNNPRRGDIKAVAKSYEMFGQRKPLVVKKEASGRGTILAGNTQFKAARDELPWTHVAVVWTEDDDQTALGFVLADNRTHDLGDYDSELLFDAISAVEDPEIRGATGYDDDFIQELVDAIERDSVVPSDPMGGAEPGKSGANPVIQYAIVFSTEEQQSRWFKFVRWLKATHPEEETLADRLDVFLRNILDDAEQGDGE